MVLEPETDQLTGRFDVVRDARSTLAPLRLRNVAFRQHSGTKRLPQEKCLFLLWHVPAQHILCDVSAFAFSRRPAAAAIRYEDHEFPIQNLIR